MNRTRKGGPPQAIQRRQAQQAQQAQPPATLPDMSAPQGQLQQMTFAAQQVTMNLPIPLPHILDAYKAIRPDLLDKLVEWSADEQAHRRAMDIRDRDIADGQLKRDHVRDLLGMGAGVFVVLVFAGVGVYALAMKQEVGGVTALVVAAGQLLGLFMKDRRVNKPAEPGS